MNNIFFANIYWNVYLKYLLLIIIAILFIVAVVLLFVELFVNSRKVYFNKHKSYKRKLVFQRVKCFDHILIDMKAASHVVYTRRVYVSKNTNMKTTLSKSNNEDSHITHLIRK